MPLSSLDGFLGQSPPDPAFANVTRRAQKWSYPWAEDDNDLTAPQQWVARNLAHASAALAMNVTGHASLQWRTRTSSPQLTAVADYAWNTSLTTEDFLANWALSQFGPSIAEPAAAILVRIDSWSMPRPVKCDPGCMKPDAAQCNWRSTYAWVDEFAALRPTLLAAVAGAATSNSDVDAAEADAAALERFDYFASLYMYTRNMAVLQCDWADFNVVWTAVSGMPDGAARRAAAVARVFPAFASLVANATALITELLSATSSHGDLGTLAMMIDYLPTGDAQQLAVSALAGGVPLPPACVPPTSYAPDRPPQLRVLTVRTLLDAGEPLRLRALVLAAPAAAAPGGCVLTAYVRSLFSSGPFAQTQLDQVAPEGATPRAVWAASIAPPPPGADVGSSDFEWFLQARCGGINVTLVFPPGAPAVTNTVVVLPAGRGS